MVEGTLQPGVHSRTCFDVPVVHMHACASVLYTAVRAVSMSFSVGFFNQCQYGTVQHRGVIAESLCKSSVHDLI